VAAPYPKPDRSGFEPNFSKTPENEALDLAWQEGILSDGRAYRVEYWCQDQTSFLTFFLSTTGLEEASKEAFKRLLEAENLIHFKPGPNYVEGRKWTDHAGNEMWSINVVVGDEENTFVEGGVALIPYPRS
jgi:hypothetical protein